MEAPPRARATSAHALGFPVTPVRVSILSGSFRYTTPRGSLGYLLALCFTSLDSVFSDQFCSGKKKEETELSSLEASPISQSLARGYRLLARA